MLNDLFDKIMSKVEKVFECCSEFDSSQLLGNRSDNDMV